MKIQTIDNRPVWLATTGSSLEYITARLLMKLYNHNVKN